MSFSNSFDAEFLHLKSASQSPWPADEAPLSGIEPTPETTEASPYLHWQEHLLPLSCIAQEDNLTVLRVELEKAHQLLQFQQVTIDTLTEQMGNRDLHLQHAQDECTVAQQICERQTAELAELEAICRDLKVQLRRQQQRVLQYRNVLKSDSLTHTVTHTVALPQDTPTPVVAFGYESISVETHPSVPHPSAMPSRASTAKSLPVRTWSAPGSIDLTGPLACYRKLATIRMTTTSVRLETRPRSTSSGEATRSVSTPAKPQPSSSSHEVTRVELPSFTRSSSH